MPSPPIQLFLTTIASAPALRQRQEYLLRILQVKKIAFVSYDLASDENAKRLWRRRAPKDQFQTLPGMLIGGRWRGSFEQFEEAVERGELETFLRLNEDYDPDLDGKVLASGPIGVPGAAMPLQMQGHKPSFAPTGPTPIKKPGEEGTADELVDAGDVLPGYGFQGLKVTVNELADLAKELGLNDKQTKGIKKVPDASTASTSQSAVPSKETEEVTASPAEKLEKSTSSKDKVASASGEDMSTAAGAEKDGQTSPEIEIAEVKLAKEGGDGAEETVTVAPLKLGSSSPAEQKVDEKATPAESG